MPTTYNKVTAGGQTLIDLSQDTVTLASHIMAGYIGHLADGTQVTGTGQGGGAVEEKQVNFIDYDGTILHSYTAQEANALTELPSNPSHTGLTAQGWNWTLQQIKDQLTYMPAGKIWVGQLYVTASGDSEIDVTLISTELTPYLGIAVNGTVTIDWGDNSAATTVTGNSNTTIKFSGHTYQSAGSYTISVHVTTGRFTFINSSYSYGSVLSNTTSFNNSNNYNRRITAIRIGSNAYLGNYSFSNCYALKTITMRTGINVQQYAFYQCYQLKSMTIPDADWYGSNTFYNCYSVSYLSTPYRSPVSSQYASTFSSCSCLQGITFPYGITGLGSSVNSNCRALKNVSIPSTVTSLPSSAFSNCYGLEEIHFTRSTPPTGNNSNWYNNLCVNCKIYVPYSADHSVLAAYKSASNYPSSSTYAYIEE